jgi:hypothetical protein
MHDHGGRETPARPPRPPRRRWRPRLAVLVAMLALTLAVAACGGGGKANGVASLSGANKPTATTSPGGSHDDRQAALDFARCMRQHGIDMPDPKFNGNGITQKFTARAGSPGPDDPTFKAAQQACQKYLPNGGQPTKPNLQEQQQMLAFARCMRQHGIDVPDPKPGGGIDLGGGGPGTANPDSPRFKAAEQACQQYEPKGKKSTQSNGSGQ